MPNSRIFVTLPRFSDGVPVTLGYIQGNSLQVEPYPSYNWHSSNGQNCDGMTSVLRVAIDKCKQLWVLDTGKIGGDWKCNPQLLVFDLKSDKLLRRFRFDRKLYTNDSLFATPVRFYFI
jgi:Major royal jelly protein